MKTVISGVKAPLLHIPPQFPDKTVLPPVQKEVGPVVVIIEGAGNISLLTTLVFILIAPDLESPLPNNDEPANRFIAPLLTTLPLKTKPSPRLNAPFICQ